jgi:glyoxylate reductase
MDADTINKLPETIKVISNFAVGFGNIDLEAAKKRGIAVTNTPEVLSDATAEIGILLILGACRRASEGIEAARESNWKWSSDYLIGKQLTGTRLGILGMGRIGQKIANIARSLGMIIHYHNRSKLSEDKEQGAVYHDNLKSLFSVSDVLSICCPATKETENMINKETVEYFPKGAVITNVARGDIVDDEALIDALNRRKIYAAGLDVYKNEPNLNPGYLKNKSVFILPHLGSATKDTRIAMANLAIDNINEFFETGNCKNKVN